MKTTEPEFNVELSDWAGAAQELYGVRRTVIIDEQGVPQGLEHDEFDARCRHVLGSFTNGWVFAPKVARSPKPAFPIAGCACA